MKRPPCIKGLEAYKKGCPEKAWDGQEGCPCWKEYIVSMRENPLKKEARKQCIDIWNHEFLWASMGLQEGVQQAVETFRNNMTTEEGVPKPDPAMVQLLQLFHLQQQARLIANNS
jgi:hypothetical protein